MCVCVYVYSMYVCVRVCVCVCVQHVCVCVCLCVSCVYKEIRLFHMSVQEHSAALSCQHCVSSLG